MDPKIKKTALLGFFTAMAIILSILDSMLSSFVTLPGVKLGLANLCVLFILLRYSWKEAALVSLVRILVTGFAFGGLSGILFSLAGAAVSLFVMTLLQTGEKSSVLFTSMAGGISHALAQLAIAVPVARLSASQIRLLVTLWGPVLVISGMVTGAFIGFLTAEVLKRVKI